MSQPINPMNMCSDKIRVSAYFDPNGKVANIDVVLNVDGVTYNDINAIVNNIANAPVAPPATKAEFFYNDPASTTNLTTTNGTTATTR